MPPNDPFLPLRNWRSMLFRGDKPGIDRFMQQLDAKMPAGWSRDSSYERQRQRPDRIRSYLFDQPGDASVRVWVQLVTPTRVRAGDVQLLRHPPLGHSARIGELVADFASGHVLPAAATSGVRCTNPSFGPRSAVTLAADMLFTQLANTADGEWPFGDRTQGVWEELVSCCLSEQVAIDRTELTKWLADSGWEQGGSGGNHRTIFRGLQMAGQAAGGGSTMTTIAQAVAKLNANPRPVLFLDTCASAGRCPGPASQPDRYRPGRTRTADAGGHRNHKDFRSGHRASRMDRQSAVRRGRMARPGFWRSRQPGNSPMSSSNRRHLYRRYDPEP